MNRSLSIALVVALVFSLGCASQKESRRIALDTERFARPAPPESPASPPPEQPTPPAPAPPPPAPREEPSSMPDLEKLFERLPAPAVEDDRPPVRLNFDNMEISLVIQSLAELIGLNYILAPGVQGRVTMQTTSEIPPSSLFVVLGEILEVNNLTMVKSGDYYKIVPTSQARQKEIETYLGDEAVPPGNRIITKVVPLNFIKPSEVIKILNPLKSAAGLYLAHDPSRLLFLTDSTSKVREQMKIVQMLDVDTFERIQVELYPVQYADVEEIAKELTQVVNTIVAPARGGKSLFKIIPVIQVSSLLVISGEPGLAENILSWVAKLDQPSTGVGEQIFVYHLSHAKAEDIAGVLSKVFKDSKEDIAPAAVSEPAETPAAPGGTNARRLQAALGRSLSTPAPAASEGLGKASASPVNIVPDKATNSLLIQTAAWYYPVVEGTIKKLDTMPKQVLIEVLIAEITLDDENRFGLQWAFKGQGTAEAFGESHGFSSQAQNIFNPDGSGVPIPTTGFSFLVTEASRVTAVLNAYAKAAKLNILSAPHILAMDNQEAKIDVGAEVPILTTRTTETAGTTDDVTGTVTNDIEYRDTGIILTVTPYINEGRYVTLEVKQEVSEAQTNTLGGTDSPIIRKRKAETTMVVKDKQTLVIGGLIEEKRDRSREGIPFLSSIPVLGYLFGTTVEKLDKTELVLLITPRVILSPEEGREVSEQLKNRALTLKEGIDLFTQEKEMK